MIYQPNNQNINSGSGVTNTSKIQSESNSQRQIYHANIYIEYLHGIFFNTTVRQKNKIRGYYPKVSPRCCRFVLRINHNMGKNTKIKLVGQPIFKQVINLIDAISFKQPGQEA